MESLSQSLDVPVAALLGIGLLIVVQLTLQVIAVVGLVRTPAARVSLGGRKWLWVLIIVLGEIVGPILWFAAGRTAAPADDSARRPNEEQKRSAADALYGDRNEP